MLSNVRMYGGCWLWQGTVDTNGYSKVGLLEASLKFKTRIGHRIMFQLYGNVIPEGYTLDHTCNVYSCVNPAHLEPMTQGENNRKRDDRRYGVGLFPCGHERSKTGYVKKEGRGPSGCQRTVTRCKPCTLAYYKKKNLERKLRLQYANG